MQKDKIEKKRGRERIDSIALISPVIMRLHICAARMQCTTQPSGFKRSSLKDRVSASNKNYAVRQRERNGKRAASSSARRNEEANFVTCRRKFVSTYQGSVQRR